jgi:Na+-translocating ferredoxin:NAD+ oxidoreductase RnfA subunit
MTKKPFLYAVLFCIGSAISFALVELLLSFIYHKSIPEQFDKGTIIAWVLFAVAAGVIGFFQARKVLKDDEKKDPE